VSEFPSLFAVAAGSAPEGSPDPIVQQRTLVFRCQNDLKNDKKSVREQFVSCRQTNVNLPSRLMILLCKETQRLAISVVPPSHDSATRPELVSFSNLPCVSELYKYITNWEKNEIIHTYRITSMGKILETSINPFDLHSVQAGPIGREGE
jgi:hypothetical protein